MMIFTPKGTNESVCIHIFEYETGRPPRSDAYIGVSWFLFILSCILWSVSIVIFWRFRNHQRFRTIRPFFLSLFLAVSQIIFSLGIGLNRAIYDLPCVVLLISMILGFMGFGVNYFIRLLVYIIESQYAMRLERPKLDTQDHFEENASTASDSEGNSLWLATSRISALVALLKMALGFTKLDDFSSGELLTTSHSFWVVTLLLCVPAPIATFSVLGKVTPYQYCSGCAIFLDVFICFLVILSIYIALSSRILFVAWKLKFKDEQGLFSEFVWTIIAVETPMVIASLLLLMDPLDVQFNNMFAFEWLLSCTTFIHWWIAAGYQFWCVYSLTRSSTRVDDAFETGNGNKADDYLQLIDSNNELKEEFSKYTKSCYAIENLYFVGDVRSFKSYFYEKPPNWRKQKATFLFNTYIKTGSIMEVNISALDRSKIVKEIETNLETEDTALYSAFDKAAEDITRNVLQDIWYQFKRKHGSFISRKPLTSTLSVKSFHQMKD